MQQFKRLICLSYPTINFFITEEKISTVMCCHEQELKNDRINLSSTEFFHTPLPYIDFDSCAKNFSSRIFPMTMRTTLVLKNTGIFPAPEYFALITSADCKIIEKDLSSFSLFSGFYSKHFTKKGIFAEDFSESVLGKIGFLLDLNKFLQFSVTYNTKRTGENRL